MPINRPNPALPPCAAPPVAGARKRENPQSSFLHHRDNVLARLPTCWWRGLPASPSRLRPVWCLRALVVNPRPPSRRAPCCSNPQRAANRSPYLAVRRTVRSVAPLASAGETSVRHTFPQLTAIAANRTFGRLGVNRMMPIYRNLGLVRQGDVRSRTCRRTTRVRPTPLALFPGLRGQRVRRRPPGQPDFATLSPSRLRQPRPSRRNQPPPPFGFRKRRHPPE